VLLAIGDRRQLERAQHGALVRDADADALVEAAHREELAKRVAEGDLVHDFAVAHDVGGQRRRGGALGANPAVHVRLDRRHEPGLDVQTDERLLGSPAERERPRHREPGREPGRERWDS